MKQVVITGACGFIGSCLARRLLRDGHRVVGLDNLSRAGSEFHAEELEAGGMSLHRLDLADADAVASAFESFGEVDAVFHLAAQVAVTTSYVDRSQDFRDNALATFNLLEAVARHTPNAYALYASTNKVYGHIEVFDPVGIDMPLDPYTPYGVSKAAAEMYFSEYGRPEIGLTTCSLRQSCIYGHYQFGVEDQGWMAWFAIANLFDLPLTIYGDGQQVRDLLFVEDLIDLYLEAWNQRFTGAVPVGGGPSNAISLLKGLELISARTGKPFDISYDETRPGDQPYFVADLGWLEQSPLAWRPRIGVEDGVDRMIGWIEQNRDQAEQVLESRLSTT